MMPQKYLKNGVNKIMNARRGTTKSGGTKHLLDKFYTKPSVAADLIAKTNVSNYDLVIEPSAGSGSFSLQIPNCLSFDLDPEHPSIVKKDWFSYTQQRIEGRKTLVIGNPPFGQQNNLAVKFINHAANFADTIAFVLPLSFQKESVQRRLNEKLHLTQSIILPKNSFILNGEYYDVPSVFQIWNWNTRSRETSVVPQLVGFEWVKKNGGPDLFLQRVGGNAGTFGTDWENRSEQSNYFMKLKNVPVQDVLEEFRKLKFIARDLSVGPRSISKKEVLDELHQIGSFLVQK